MQQLVELQRRFFDSNTTKPYAFRLAQLQKLKAVVGSNEGALQQAIRRDFGKGTFETFLTELHSVHDELNTAIDGLRDWMRIKSVPTDPLNTPAMSYVVPEPLGTSLIIAPWSSPYQLSLGPVVAAIAAGCTIILKPSELTANCSRALADLIGENFDQGYFAVVEGAVPETTRLLEQKFDVIFFAGSVPAGRIVYEAAARHLTPVILVMGGKSPAIVAADANLDIAVRRLVWAKFLNAGQTCIAPDYVCVQNSIEQRFLDAVAREITLNDYRVANGNYVQMIDEKNAIRLAELIDMKKVVIGGGYDLHERFVEPTLLTNIRWDDPVMQEEIFGPVLPVLAYDGLDDLIRRIKDGPRPPALYLFTEDERVKDKVLGELSFGGGCVNDAVMHTANVHLPFGGVGASGLGSCHGEHGFAAFSHFKGILDKPVAPDPAVRYSPHTDEKLGLLRSIVALDAASGGTPSEAKEGRDQPAPLSAPARPSATSASP